MKITALIARYLLGLMFTIFGLNGFLHFIPQPMPANPLAEQFLIAVSASHFAAFFFTARFSPGCCYSPASLSRSRSSFSQRTL